MFSSYNVTFILDEQKKCMHYNWKAHSEYINFYSHKQATLLQNKQNMAKTVFVLY